LLDVAPAAVRPCAKPSDCPLISTAMSLPSPPVRELPGAKCRSGSGQKKSPGSPLYAADKPSVP